MKKLFTLILIAASLSASAQNEVFKYEKILEFDSLSKDDIYTKTLVWAGKVFLSSNDAIRVKEKESGIISGKASTHVIYFIPKGKKDSTQGFLFNKYSYDWTIQIKDNKLKFSISSPMVGDGIDQHLVTNNENAGLSHLLP